MKMKKVLAMLLAVLMIVTATVAGTVAWLTTSTQEVENTFTTSDINITLDETGTTESGGKEVKEFQMIPGDTLYKDPTVTVKAGSEDCWLFVEVTEACTVADKEFDDYLTYAIAGGWTQGDGTSIPANVWYREVTNVTADAPFSVLENDQVSVRPSVTKEMMNAFDTDKSGALDENEKKALPTLTFKAYAVQQSSFETAAKAWAEAVKLDTP